MQNDLTAKSNISTKTKIARTVIFSAHTAISSVAKNQNDFFANVNGFEPLIVMLNVSNKCEDKHFQLSL